MNLDLRGELRFHFLGGSTVHCLIYVSHDFRGELCETEEAIPLWFPVSDLPYGEMWADDRHWLPLLLAGQRFRGSVNVEGEESVDQEIEVLPAAGN